MANAAHRPIESARHKEGAQTILVIGNSDGIGAEVTRALLARGDRVVGISRSASPLTATGLRHEVQDVTSPEFPGLVRRLLHEESGVDACVYCAGIGSGLELPDLSGEARVFDVNLTAMVRVVEILVPYWLERGRGHLVGLSSIADDLYVADAPSYCASKAGMSHYLISLGLKLRSRNVAVTNVRFGFVDTKMAKSPIKPLLMTPERAAHHVLRCLTRRPLQFTAPKTVGAAVHILQRLQSLRVWMT